MENRVYALLHTWDMAISRYRDFGFPIDWLLDSGVVGKVGHEGKKNSLLLIVGFFALFSPIFFSYVSFFTIFIRKVIFNMELPMSQ